MYFAGALSYLWLCPVLSVMLYSPPQSNPALLFSTSYAEYLSGLSQVKVSNNIILEGIRQGANPPFMLSKKYIVLVVLNFKCRPKYRKSAFLSISD